jgi:biliverdin reductase
VSVALRFGIAGMGVAGLARARAIHNDPTCVLVGAFRGRVEEAAVPSYPTWEALLRDVDVAAVCAPDDCHQELVEAALLAGKPVVCEYPLALRAENAGLLYARARLRHLPLHVEHIELLTPAAVWLRQRCEGRRLLSGVLRFVGPPRPGSIAGSNLARLSRLCDAVGFPESVRVHQRGDRLLRAWLGAPTWADGVEVEFRQEEGATRRTELQLHLDDGDVLQLDQTVFDGGLPVALPASPGLFAADHRAFVDHLRQGSPLYCTPDRELRLLRLSDVLSDQKPTAPADEQVLAGPRKPRPTADSRSYGHLLGKGPRRGE